MRCERLGPGEAPARIAARIRALVPNSQSVSEAVAEIIAQVRAHGDTAVREYTRQFDSHGAEPGPIAVRDAELEAAARQLDPNVRTGLKRAIANVRRVAEAGLTKERTVDFGGHRVMLREAPVRRAGIYVPGGRAPYPSTVVMGVVTARVAGVGEVVVCAPPNVEGHLDPTVLAACRLTGAWSVFCMGGAQAVAALAYGTETVPAVDVLVGPGNLYVQEAKRQVFGQVAIDGFAGPTDLMVIASSGARPELVALDLLAQCEHGAGTLVVAVSEQPELLDEVETIVREAGDTGAVAALVAIDRYDGALELAEEFAPEHLQLMGAEAEELASRISRAGCLFVGGSSASAFGDYITGSNHVLPTAGAARFASALSPSHFRRRFSEVRVDGGAGELAGFAAPVARAEGFELHARSMEARVRENGSK
ncbi:MAG TPA: histidinol dehydrogenase [Solirubrobacteraceae bacterium]